MMQSSEWVLKAILSRCGDEKRKVLESFLSPQEREQLDLLPPFEGTFDEQEPPLLDRIHWSWFLPILKAHAPKEQKLFVSALPTSFQEPLKRSLKMRELDESLSGVGKKFLLKILQANLTGEEWHLLPISLVPPSPFFPLLTCDKNKIVHFIDLLSLYDLAEMMQRIVETKILKKIYSFLSGEELSFLKVAMAQKQKGTLARLKLDSWDGSEKKFRLLLHKRGLARFGIALSTESPDLIWYICHSLDIGRGASLEKATQIEATVGVKKMVLKQAETVLQHGFS